MFMPPQHRADFRPSCCPNPKCRYHSRLRTGWRYKKSGFYSRRLVPHRIQRFTCSHCRRSFSSQTFSTTYWQRLPELSAQLLTKTTGCMANRQIARDLQVSPETVTRQLARLGRHCLLYHAGQMQCARPVRELVIDGFVSFEWSQYFPFHHHLAVEKETDYFVYFTDSEVRRSGGMTERQRRRREQLERRHGRPDPQAVSRDVGELVSVAIGGQGSVTIYSDEHRAYRRALGGMPAVVRHEVTSSRARRDRDNPLWEVNLLDLLIRHSGANHKRETVAWSKRRLGSALRLAVMLVWRNYVKGRREKVRGSPTPAMARGMAERPLQVEELLQERLFASQIDLPPRWAEYYWGRVRTRVMVRQRSHRLKYAE